MSTATSENQCTGCGATVTQWGMEKYWRDVSGSTYCEGIPVVQNQHYVLPEVKNVSLPPVAIKPEAPLTPLEKELITALNDASGCLTSRNGCDPQAALKIIGAALFIAEDRDPKTEASEPTPGSMWLDEGKDSDPLLFVYVANNGRNATCISIKKSDGSIHSINLHGYIVSDCKPMAVQV